MKDLADQVKHAGKSVSRLERKLQAERRKQDPSRRKIGNVRFRLHQKKRRQATLQARLDPARADARRTVPKICFGGRAKLRRGETGAWREQRTRMITLVGSKDEIQASVGNFSRMSDLGTVLAPSSPTASCKQAVS